MNINEKNEKHIMHRTAEHDSDDCDKCNHQAQKSRELFNYLNIPIIKSTSDTGSLSADVKVQGHKLYDILMDEEKLNILVSKLHNKDFW